MAETEQETLPVREAREGDPDAWDVLFRRYQKPLYVYVFELIRYEQPSLDIVQETFIRAARHVEQLETDGKFGSWLFGIAHRQCIDYWRRAERRQVFEDQSELETIGDPLPDPASELIRREEHKAFLNAIESLRPPHRAVILLYYMEDFSIEEIAEVIGIDPGTVKSRLHYARKTIRQQLKGDL